MILAFHLVSDPHAFDIELLRLSAELDEHLRTAVQWIADSIAGRAQIVHGYTVRTGRLITNTVSTLSTGSFLEEGEAEATAMGATPYGEFVEWRSDYGDKYAYLKPAFETLGGLPDYAIERELEDAARIATWV